MKFKICNFFKNFNRLTGFSPFYGKSYNEILSKNRKCEIQYDVEGMDKRLSKECTQLFIFLKINII